MTDERREEIEREGEWLREKLLTEGYTAKSAREWLRFFLAACASKACLNNPDNTRYGWEVAAALAYDGLHQNVRIN